MCGLVLTVVLIENVFDLLFDSLTIVLTLGTALALVNSGSVDKGVTRYVVSSRLNSIIDLLERKCFERLWAGRHRVRIDLH